MKMQTVVCENAALLHQRVAEDLKQYILQHPGALLCLAAGDTPLPVYTILTDMAKRGEVDLNSVYYVGLDEWVGLGAECRGTCLQVMQDAFYGPAGILPDHMAVSGSLCRDPTDHGLYPRPWRYWLYAAGHRHERSCGFQRTGNRPAGGRYSGGSG